MQILGPKSPPVFGNCFELIIRTTYVRYKRGGFRGPRICFFLNILPVCQVFFVKTIGYFFEIRFSWKDALSKYLSIHMCKKSFTWQINSFHFFIGSYWRFFHNSGQSWEKLFFGHVGRDPIRPTHKQDLISSQIFWSFMYRKFQRCHWTFKSDLHKGPYKALKEVVDHQISSF